MMIRTKVFLKFSITVQVLQVLQANGCQNNVQANFLCNQIKAKVQKKGLQNQIKLKLAALVSFISINYVSENTKSFSPFALPKNNK